MEKIAYTVAEASEALGISKPTFYKLSQMEDFPIFRSGRIVRVPIQPLKDWFAAHTGEVNER